MEKKFSNLHSGEEACLYTIQNGGLTAKITNLGATLVQLWVPDASGTVQDVVHKLRPTLERKEEHLVPMAQENLGQPTDAFFFAMQLQLVVEQLGAGEFRLPDGLKGRLVLQKKRGICRAIDEVAEKFFGLLRHLSQRAIEAQAHLFVLDLVDVDGDLQLF